MKASQTCDLLITYVKKSSLNSCLSESPFGISISIKKIFFRTRHSQLCKFEEQVSNRNVESFHDQNVSRQSTVAKLESNQEALKHTLSDMEIKLQKSENDKADLLDEKNCVGKAKEIIEVRLDMKQKNLMNFMLKLSS